MRFGVITTEGEREWFFTRWAANIAAGYLIAEGRHGWIVSGELVNDEGCTPYIETRNKLETF